VLETLETGEVACELKKKQAGNWISPASGVDQEKSGIDVIWPRHMWIWPPKVAYSTSHREDFGLSHSRMYKWFLFWHVKYYKNPTTFRDTIKKTLHSA
jgi:hypothetical protein